MAPASGAPSSNGKTAVSDTAYRGSNPRGASSILPPRSYRRSELPITGIAAVPGRSDALACVCRSEEHTSELQSLMRTSYAVFCLKKKQQISKTSTHTHITHDQIVPLHRPHNKPY